MKSKFYHFTEFISILHSVVPSSSPNNVTVSSSATTISVMWTNVQEIDRNGIIVAFEILYIPLNTFEGVLVQGMINTSASNRSVEINSLEEYVQYNVSVRAYTSIGPGPFSSPVTARTLENGNNIRQTKLFSNYPLCFPSSLESSFQCYYILHFFYYYGSNVG